MVFTYMKELRISHFELKWKCVAEQDILIGNIKGEIPHLTQNTNQHMNCVFQ